MISVSDTGIGIAQTDQNRIFQSFEQVDSSQSRRHQGTGLGLALTRRMVELHGGRIWVESEGIGKGSRFACAIPDDSGTRRFGCGANTQEGSLSRNREILWTIPGSIFTR